MRRPIWLAKLLLATATMLYITNPTLAEHQKAVQVAVHEVLQEDQSLKGALGRFSMDLFGADSILARCTRRGNAGLCSFTRVQNPLTGEWMTVGFGILGKVYVSEKARAALRKEWLAL